MRVIPQNFPQCGWPESQLYPQWVPVCTSDLTELILNLPQCQTCRSSWWKILLHFYYKCSSVSGTILLVVQQSYMYKSNRSLRLLWTGCVRCQVFKVITQLVWQKVVAGVSTVPCILSWCCTCTIQVLLQLKARFMVLQVYCKWSHKMFMSAMNWVCDGITQAIKDS